MWPVLSLSDGSLPLAFAMHCRDHTWSINPKKELKMVDNKQLPLLITKAKSRDFGRFFYYKGAEKMVEKDEKLQAKNRDFLDFTSGALPPVDDNYHLDDYNLLSASKTLAEELAASTSFAEAAYIYPSSTATLSAALTHARNLQSSTNSKIHDYISLSNNIPPTSSPRNNIREVEKLISQGKVSAVFVEPIHGNGGLRTFTPHSLQSLRSACDKSGVLLAFDEVQCGLGQTGRLWAHQALGVEPDLMMVQFRDVDIGALVVNKRMNGHMIHNYENEHMYSVTRKCGEALNIFRKVSQRGYLTLVTRKGRYLEDILVKRLGGNTRVIGIRVFGLQVAMELAVDAQSFANECKKHGLGILVTGRGNIIRIMPPFNVNTDELDDAVEIMEECLNVVGADDWVKPFGCYSGDDWVKPFGFYSDY